MSEKHVTVSISKKLYEEIGRRVKESRGEFRDVQEYIEFVLNELIKEDDETQSVYTPEEEEQIKKRLRKLGYL